MERRTEAEGQKAEGPRKTVRENWIMTYIIYSRAQA